MPHDQYTQLNKVIEKCAQTIILYYRESISYERATSTINSAIRALKTTSYYSLDNNLEL